MQTQGDPKFHWDHRAGGRHPALKPRTHLSSYTAVLGEDRGTWGRRAPWLPDHQRAEQDASQGTRASGFRQGLCPQLGSYLDRGIGRGLSSPSTRVAESTRGSACSAVARPGLLVFSHLCKTPTTVSLKLGMRKARFLGTQHLPQTLAQRGSMPLCLPRIQIHLPTPPHSLYLLAGA